jgi:hypothetical protein
LLGCPEVVCATVAVRVVVLAMTGVSGWLMGRWWSVVS